MIYAQIKDGVVKSLVELASSEQEAEFLVGFNYLIRVDTISPHPGIGWLYDPSPLKGIHFTFSDEIQNEEIEKELDEVSDDSRVNELSRNISTLAESQIKISDLQRLFKILEDKVSKEDFKTLVNDYNRRVVEVEQMSDVLQSLNTLSNKILKLEADVLLLQTS